MEKNYKRRSISIPLDLERIIEYKFKKSNYSHINDMIIELIELGLIKDDENLELKNKYNELILKLNELLKRF